MDLKAVSSVSEEYDCLPSGNIYDVSIQIFWLIYAPANSPL